MKLSSWRLRPRSRYWRRGLRDHLADVFYSGWFRVNVVKGTERFSVLAYAPVAVRSFSYGRAACRADGPGGVCYCAVATLLVAALLAAMSASPGEVGCSHHATLWGSEYMPDNAGSNGSRCSRHSLPIAAALVASWIARWCRWRSPWFSTSR
jgi:hypothetical protein